MPEERTLKITCDECGYSEIVPSSRLAYEEAKSCPKCRTGKMWWVPLAEEARRREVKKMPGEEKRISPAVIILPVGLGLGLAAVVGLVALAREEEAPPEEGPPEEEPPIAPLAFTFGTPVVSTRMSNYIDFEVYQVSCSITNPHSSVLTRTIYCCWSWENDPDSLACGRVWGSNKTNAYVLTLNPGQTVTLTSPYSYCIGIECGDNTPVKGFVGGVPRRFWFCFRDDLGNRSVQVLK